MTSTVRWTILGALGAIALVGIAVGLSRCSREPDAPAPRTNIEEKTTLSCIDGIESCLDLYKKDVGRYPTAAQGLGVLFERPADPADATRWKGPYLEAPEVLYDAWSHPLQYAPPGPDGNMPYVWSRGPNGQNDFGAGDDITGRAGPPPAAPKP